MGAIEKITIVLPEEVLRDVRASVAAGQYTDIGTALADHWVAAAQAHGQDAGLEAWLNGPAKEAYRDFNAGTLETISHSELAAQIEADRAEDRAGA